MKKLCEPDKRNEFFGITLDVLDKQLAGVPISPKVPGKIHTMLNFARKICLYAYYEYEFYSLCFIYLSLVTETSIKERFLLELPERCLIHKKKKEKTISKKYNTVFQHLLANWRIVGYEEVNKSLLSILRWLRKNTVQAARFSDQRMKWYVEIRNMSAHLESHYVNMPTIVIPIFWQVVDFVNCLFDSGCHGSEPRVIVEQRKYYQDMYEAWQKFAQKKKADGKNI